MSGTRYNIYEVQLQDDATDLTITAAGGGFLVTAAGDTSRVTLFNPDTFAALPQPVVPVRGKIRFATLATVLAVDLYGFAPGGQFVSRRGVLPGGTTEVYISSNMMDHVAVIPFDCSQFTANVEFDTGLDFPLHSLVLPFPAVRVTQAEGSRTIECGLLSSETAGDLDGFVDAVSLATAGLVDCSTAGTPTLGALLVQNFATSPAVNVRDAHAITGANARSISIMSSASAVSAKGMILLPYQLAPL